MVDIARLDSTDADFDARLEALVSWEADEGDGVERAGRDIIADVRARGDAAVLDYTRRFDRRAVETASALVPPGEVT